RIVVKQFAESDPERKLVVAGLLNMAADTKYFGAGACSNANLLVGVCAIVDDPRHIRQRLDIIDDGRLTIEATTFIGGERRADTGLAELAFEAIEQRSFFAANVRASAEVRVDFHREGVAVGVLDRAVRTEQPCRAGFRDTLVKRVSDIPKLAT